MADAEPKAHRGRVEAQGGNLEKSVDWGQDTAPFARDGHGWLDELRGKLTAREQRDREDGFAQAHVGVDRMAAAGGVPKDGRYPVSKSFPKPPRMDGRRVDIEVSAGRAFMPNPIDVEARTEVPDGDGTAR